MNGDPVTPDDTLAVADIRLTVEMNERRIAALEGRVQSLSFSVSSMDKTIQRLTVLVTDSIEYTSAYVSEVRKSIASTEEHLVATRRAVEVMVEQQGRMLRELSELKKR